MTEQFLSYCEKHEAFLVRQIEQDLIAFKKALPELRKRRREKFMKGVKEHGEGFLELPKDKLRTMQIEEWMDLLHYIAQPHFLASKKKLPKIR